MGHSRHSGTLFLEGPKGLVPSTSGIISPAPPTTWSLGRAVAATGGIVFIQFVRHWPLGHTGRSLSADCDGAGRWAASRDRGRVAGGRRRVLGSVGWPSCGSAIWPGGCGAGPAAGTARQSSEPPTDGRAVSQPASDRSRRLGAAATRPRRPRLSCASCASWLSCAGHSAAPHG